MTTQQICPDNVRHVGDVRGCGKAFRATPDFEGFVDCPHCGLRHRPNPDAKAWISVTERLPEEGDEIEGKAGFRTWPEVWDGSEPVGKMTHWRLL